MYLGGNFLFVRCLVSNCVKSHFAHFVRNYFNFMHAETTSHAVKECPSAFTTQDHIDRYNLKFVNPCDTGETFWRTG